MKNFMNTTFKCFFKKLDILWRFEYLFEVVNVFLSLKNKQEATTNKYALCIQLEKLNDEGNTAFIYRFLLHVTM